LHRLRENINIFFILLVAFIMYKVIDNHYYFITQLRFLWTLMSPFIWAFGIAYILNPLMVWLESNRKIKRPVSLAIVYVMLLGVLTLMVTIVTPVILQNITDIMEKLPGYIARSERWVNEKIIEFGIIEGLGESFFNFNDLNRIFTRVLNFLNITFSTLINRVVGITSGIAKMLLGLLISVYLLADKEKFISSIKRICYAYLGESKSEELFEFGRETDRVFSNFLIGKLIDSAIIGLICYIGLSLLRVNFALLLSIIVGVCNMIPYFGPFIGAVPAVLITLFYDPPKALWVTLFVLALQQFDGLILGPKILGDKVGLSPFYIILSIIIGGGFFGIIGMLLGVPVLKTIFILFGRDIDRRLKKDSYVEEQVSNNSCNNLETAE
jgi:predicted PurR-regulated permease PerM